MDSGGDGDDNPQTIAALEWPEPPRFRFSPKEPPRPIHQLSASKFIPRQDKTEARGALPSQRFWRRAQWSPDGTHLLAQTEAHELDLFSLTEGSSAAIDDQSQATGPSSSDSQKYGLQHVFRIASPTTILDYGWYPFARYDDPTSWCFIYSSTSIPSKLIDAYNGSVRATYGFENHIEQFIGPQAMAFSMDGSSLYCGVEASLACFAMVRPGTNTCSTLPLLPNRRAQGKHFQRGVISSIVVGPAYAPSASAGGELIVVGTFAGTVGIYERAGDAAPGEWTAAGRKVKVAHELCLAGWIEEEGTGVTQLLLHPTTPYLLFVSSRRSALINCYDLRYLSSIPDFTLPSAKTTVIAIFQRSPEKNASATVQQRLFFDVDWAGRWLVAGDSQGRLRVWNLEDETANVELRTEGSTRTRMPHLDLALQKDSICSLGLHPLRPLLLATSGSRQWPESFYSRDSSVVATGEGSGSETSCSASSSEGSSTLMHDQEHITLPAVRARESWFARDAKMVLWDAS
ncbi:hypothetical protein BCV69DRAFT_297674 [Microstroma glucosiphilum]|uniref:WD40 repeat-like protein n=1 Tax=Pseudomicrostroma glucosiphilum TaxID=1684307 RepID=A0A316UDD8_9BASI|nr:hypothetical protein BCV69DRAFT_297674 [Pseudomicrostroma glucosiphilum]PWN22383.1 hypothetical protein BCV69DRAFT_297674 [Pseudomicrostroma glucosiphilum]